MAREISEAEVEAAARTFCIGNPDHDLNGRPAWDVYADDARAALEAAAAARARPADADQAEVVAPPDLESPEFGRNLFRTVIGESYKPHIWGQHRALHHTSVRFALDMADRSMPEVADVLRAMIWQQVITDNRAKHAFDLATAAEATIAKLREVLRTVEWVRIGGADRSSCPSCKRWLVGGHVPDCALAAVLRDPATGQDGADPTRDGEVRRSSKVTIDRDAAEWLMSHMHSICAPDGLAYGDIEADHAWHTLDHALASSNPTADQARLAADSIQGGETHG